MVLILHTVVALGLEDLGNIAEGADGGLVERSGRLRRVAVGAPKMAMRTGECALDEATQAASAVIRARGAGAAGAIRHGTTTNVQHG